MDVFLKILPFIIVVLLIFAAKEGYSIFRYMKLCKLHEAARSGRIEKVHEYLQAGHAVNAVDPRFGLTPLHFAVRNGHAEIAKLLLRNGAGLDDPSSHGITPRQWACEYLTPETREELERLSVEMQKKQAASTLPKL